MSDKKFIPKIINEKSNFVIITYFWGRGNLNRNMQRPCPFEIVDDPSLKITKHPILFEKMIDNWKESCTKHNCNHLVVEYPEFAVKGGYQNAINFKPYFIKKALDVCYPRNVVYIDGDMTINKYPKIFDTINFDLAVRNWNIDDRENNSRNICYNPYTIELSGGTMAYGNTLTARNILDKWIQETNLPANKKKADDTILSVTLSKFKYLLTANIILLPIEFLWLTLEYDDQIHEDKYVRKQIQIEHPHCLTSEDLAMNVSGSSENNRVAKGYDYYITNKRDCKYRKSEFYEYIYFQNKSTCNTFYPYLDILNENNLVNIIPYEYKFGDYNKVAKNNYNMMRNIRRQCGEKKVIISYNEKILAKLNNTHIKNKSEKIIPLILKYLRAKQNVVVDRDFSSLRSLRNLVKITNENSELEFVCKNLNSEVKRSQKQFTLEMDKTRPFYFSCNNPILYNLLEMSSDFDAFTRHFNKSYMFISRIRCRWY